MFFIGVFISISGISGCVFNRIAIIAKILSGIVFFFLLFVCWAFYVYVDSFACVRVRVCVYVYTCTRDTPCVY